MYAAEQDLYARNLGHRAAREFKAGHTGQVYAADRHVGFASLKQGQTFLSIGGFRTNLGGISGLKQIAKTGYSQMISIDDQYACH